MTVWVVLGAMAVLALALLLPAVLRRENRAAAREAYDAQVYRDQLAEIGRDRERGVVGESEAEAARTEVARRLLAADAAAGNRADGAAAAPSASGRAVAAVTVVAAPLAAFALYAAMGSPNLPDRPAAERTAERVQPGLRRASDITALVEKLGRKLQSRPNDREGWSLYAHALTQLGRFEEGVKAWQKAVSLDPGNADWVSQLAEAQISAEGGMVTPAALASLEKTLKLDPGEPRARYYRGLADLQAGDPDSALKRWLALEADSPPAASWRKVLADRIEGLARDRKIDGKKLAALRAEAAKAASAAPRGPTAADMAAAQQMKPEDRQAMIRSMVERLAARLKDNPNDLAGWQRLERAWRVLGETAKADEAAAKVKALQAGGPAPMASVAPRGPTAAEIKAAQEMSPSDRQAMIRSMVERLAARLKDNPNDLAGWQRLERAWRVLGETAKADEAAAKIKALQGQQSGSAQPAAPPPGPTADDVTAAQKMKPEDRRAMIRSMVARLAERLKTEPNDAEGWARLGRSYRVLGELKQAREAYAKATALKPDDADVLIDYIDMIVRTADPDGPMPEALATSAARLVKLRPDHPAGYWFSGIARLQAGDKKGAIAQWKTLLTLLDPKGSQHRDLSQRIEALEKDLGKQGP